MSGASANPSGTVICRPARADEAAVLAPLVYASGEAEFQYLLGVDAGQCIAFLQRVIAWQRGHFSWRRHLVACVDDSVVAVIAIQDGRVQWSDNPLVAHAFIRHFGLSAALGIMIRGLRLEKEIPPPKRTQTLLAHCATDPAWRSRGLFRQLFDHALQHKLLPAHAGQSLVLDVLVDNPRAKALYQRCGFLAPATPRPLTSGLPRQLHAIRMTYPSSRG
ncbi:GNAT family N-acetyltransferase [Frateuria aurantia]